MADKDTATNSMILCDYESDTTLKVYHAVYSARCRVQIAEIDQGIEENKITKSILELASEDGADGDQDGVAVVRQLLKKKKLTIAEVLAANKQTPQEVQQSSERLFKIFRIACKMTGISDEWKEKINDDEFMMSQDATEVERFVNSFRRKLAI